MCTDTHPHICIHIRTDQINTHKLKSHRSPFRISNSAQLSTGYTVTTRMLLNSRQFGPKRYIIFQISIFTVLVLCAGSSKTPFQLTEVLWGKQKKTNWRKLNKTKQPFTIFKKRTVCCYYFSSCTETAGSSSK